jgi:hypothetical protein
MFASPGERRMAVVLAPSHADAHLPDCGGEPPPSRIRPGTPPQRAQLPRRRLGGLILGRVAARLVLLLYTPDGAHFPMERPN